eukprot:TRINITY_DN2573_c0_g1_i1.p1 TRINITY_DN2573_c0_g1~~TRINITY_DN2573_c0_g1_i1.p1  ORF type:complete len:500 (-),score=139.05 TRINITY_DN2573_c0_g1_i1:115-1614(-)
MGAGNSTIAGVNGNDGENTVSVATQFYQALSEIEASPDDLLLRLREISKDPLNFKTSPSKEISDSLDSVFETLPGEDEPPYVGLAKKLLELDPSLGGIRRKLVPSRIKELVFWRNYLTHIALLNSNKLALPKKTTKYSNERQVAIEAVQKACKIAQLVYDSLVSQEVITKNDKSPVTIADFSVQAVINTEIKKVFPDDPIVAEEHSRDLQNADIKAKVVRIVNSIAPPPGATEEEVLRAIDFGVHEGGPTGRFWVVDPIDGTAGFLRGGQYAVCLALIENGEVVLGVLGCPNLPQKGKEANGCIFFAEQGRGAYSIALTESKDSPVHVSPITDVKQASFCESVESGHSSHSDAADIASILGITAPPVRMDSQCKYAAIARGDASIYLRLPTSATYEEKIWDHAAGWLIVREAGGEVTDITGKPLNFSIGRTLKENKGVVATNKKIHAKVIETVQFVLNPPLKHFALAIKRERRSTKEIKEAIAAGLGVDVKLIEVEEAA